MASWTCVVLAPVAALRYRPPMARLVLGGMGIAGTAITLAMGLAACKQPFALFCEDHGDCANHPDRPFCDTTGAYTEDGRGKICIAEPFDGGLPVVAASVDGGSPVDAGGSGLVAPALLAPANGTYTGSVHATAPLRPKLRWHPVDGATSYDVQLDDSCPPTGFVACEFASSEQSEVGVSSTTWEPTASLPVSLVPPVGRRYFWRVRACDDDGCSAWSDVWYLHVGRQATDYNGDGYGDILVGAPQQDNGATDEGNAFLYWGGPAWGDLGVNAPVDAADVVIDSPGNAADGAFGGTVAGIGDIDGDGFSDLTIAGTGGAGLPTVFVYLGRASWPSVADAPDVTITAPGGQPDSLFGYTLVGADVDADGLSDLIASAGGQSNPEVDEGVVFVFLGRSTWPADLDTADVVVDNPRDQMGAFGAALAAGDVNGDGVADLVVGAPTMDNPQPSEGAVFVFLGTRSWSSGADVQLADIAIDSHGDVALGLFGFAVAAGDLNDDGFGDVVVGAYFHSGVEVAEGAVYLYFGSSVWESVVDSADTIVRNPEPSVDGRFGAFVCVGDVNGDSRGDVVAAAVEQGNPVPTSTEGNVFGFHGRDAWPGSVESASFGLDNPLGGASSNMGVLSCSGDVDGDGIADIMAGVRNASNPEETEGVVFFWIGWPIWVPFQGSAQAILDNPADQVDGEVGRSVH